MSTVSGKGVSATRKRGKGKAELRIGDCGLRINRMKSHPFLSGFVPLWLGEWQLALLSLKLRGHYNYFGVRGNYSALSAFWHKIQRIWPKALMRRSQKVCKTRLCWLIDHEFALPQPHHTS